MFCFIMALKSQRVSNDWELDCQLLDGTLRSIFNQDDPRFQVILVCHELPRIAEAFMADERLLVIQAPFEPPAGWDEYKSSSMQDKYKKIKLGLIRCAEFAPRFVMLMDADDLVSRRVTSHCLSNSEAHGFIVKTGYQYQTGSRWLQVYDQFANGIHPVVNTRHFAFPESLEDYRECVVLDNGHTAIEKAMNERNTPIEPFPFRASVYVQHANMHSRAIEVNRPQPTIRMLVGKWRRQRFLTTRLRREFGLHLNPK